MTAAISRKELHTMIDTMPDHFIQAMMPLVTCIAEEYWKPVIEPASPEEIAMIEERLKDYEADPSSFKSWREARTGDNFIAEKNGL